MRFSFLLVAVFAAGILALLGSSCATIVPPAGGPRDSLPPQLVKASPPDSAVNFRGKRIELEFDEFLDDLQDPQRNLLFTPTFRVNPTIAIKLRTLTINLKDSLEPNTTYTFNFGDAIKDINEGNVLKNFTYTFSTGPVLDSLQLSGTVREAETGKVDSTLTMLLYKNLDDSAVVRERPRYITKLDGNGNFTFRNLAPGTYAVYALGDPNNSRRYLNRTQQAFGFLDSAVVVRPGTPPLTILVYKEATPASSGTLPAISTGARPGTDKRLRFTTSLSGDQQDLLGPLTLTFENGLRLFDSTQLRLTTDSSFRPVAYTVRLDSTRRKVLLTSSWKEGTLYNLELRKGFAEDSTGRQLLRSDTLSFTTKKRVDYGNVSIKIRNVDSTLNPVLQFVQNGTVVLSAPIAKGVYTNPLFPPGEYELRVLYDRNRNGVWDPGQFFGNKRQPEVVKPIDRRANIKAGVDNDFEINL